MTSAAVETKCEFIVNDTLTIDRWQNVSATNEAYLQKIVFVALAATFVLTALSVDAQTRHAKRSTHHASHAGATTSGSGGAVGSTGATQTGAGGMAGSGGAAGGMGR